jgi:TetR/AcrR family transcriptional regulator
LKRNRKSAPDGKPGHEGQNPAPFQSTVELPEEWQSPEPGSPRARILAAARQLFAARGLEGTSIRDITDAAQVNPAMAHYYFTNKIHLYQRVLGFEILAVFRTLQRETQADLTPGELLFTIPFKVMGVVRANPTWAKLFRQEMAMGAPHLERVVRELNQSGPLGIKTQVETFYRAAVRDGELRDLPVEQVIQFLVILGYSGIFYQPLFRIMFGSDSDSDKAFEARSEAFATLIRHGLMPTNKS